MKKLKNPFSKFDSTRETNQIGTKLADNKEILGYLKENPDHRVLNCGSGHTSLIDNRVIHLDILKYEIIDLIADASSLPFKEKSFDAIFCENVLEHVKNPFQVVKEFTRVLKEKGYVSACIPFLFPYHDAPDHYFNTSTSGIQSLFEDYQPTETGILSGPWCALQNIIGNYKKMLKRVYKDPNTEIIEKIRVFCIYRLLSWGMKFNHKKIALLEEEQNILAAGVFFKGTKYPEKHGD